VATDLNLQINLILKVLIILSEVAWLSNNFNTRTGNSFFFIRYVASQQHDSYPLLFSYTRVLSMRLNKFLQKRSVGPVLKALGN